MIDILFTAPHTAVDLAALIFCWLAAIAALGLFAFQVGELIER